MPGAGVEISTGLSLLDGRFTVGLLLLLAGHVCGFGYGSVDGKVVRGWFGKCVCYLSIGASEARAREAVPRLML